MQPLTTSYDFVSHLTRFCRTLRRHGFLIGPDETAYAVGAVEVVGAMDQGRVYWTLRTLLASRKADIDVFDDLFRRFWDFQPPPPERPDVKRGMSQAGGMREFRRRPRTLFLPEADRRSEDTVVQVQRTGASATEMISDTQLTTLASDEMAMVSRIAARVVRALASRPGRRRRRHKRKGVPDLRGAFRLNMATGGDLIRLPRMRRVPRTPRLLVLLDVSGSMDRHTRLLLQLVYAVSQHTKRIETFVFSTSITRVTRQLKAPSFVEALRRVSMVVDHWSGRHPYRGVPGPDQRRPSGLGGPAHHRAPPQRRLGDRRDAGPGRRDAAYAATGQEGGLAEPRCWAPPTFSPSAAA